MLLVFLLTFAAGVGAVNVWFYRTEDARISGTVLNLDYRYSFNRSYTEHFISSDGVDSIHFVLLNKKDSKGLILFFPGTNSNAQHSYQILSSCFDSSYDLLLVEYRNSGKSRGPQSEKSYYDDAHAIYSWAKARYTEKKIILCGFSLGGPIATRVASENQPAALLLFAPLYSINEKYKFKPWQYRKYGFETFRDITRVSSPIHLFCGTKDGLYDDTERLAGLLSANHQMHRVTGEDHLGLFKSPAFKTTLDSVLSATRSTAE